MTRSAPSRSDGSGDEMAALHVPLGYPQRGSTGPESSIAASLEGSAAEV
jgi:hypothetical protein